MAYFTKENAKEYSRKGIEKMREMHEQGLIQGFSSPEVRAKAQQAKREKKKMKDDLITLLKASLKRGDIVDAEDVLSLDEAEGKNISVQTAMNIAMIKRAIHGDVSAYLAVRDTIGEKPSDKLEIDSSLTVEEWAKNHKVKL